jgi:hypothetical protein
LSKSTHLPGNRRGFLLFAGQAGITGVSGFAVSFGTGGLAIAPEWPFLAGKGVTEYPW